MGLAYEIASTPAAYARKAFYDANDPGRSTPPVRIDFGGDPLQHCVLWEPDQVLHKTLVLWFHGGGYLVGTSESMLDAANVYNSQGYRFCSVGFRLMPFHRFPAQVADAFLGIQAALTWMGAHGRGVPGIVVGGSSCGGHLACLVGYGQELQRTWDFPVSLLRGVVSCAAVVDVDDMLLRPFPSAPVWRRYVGLPTRGTSVQARHEALLPWSPLALVEDYARPGTPEPVPFFAVHGRADTMSPYAHEVAFVDRLNQIGGAGTATLHAIEDPRWQHMRLTVTMHKDRVEDSPALADLFGWLGRRAG